VDDFVAPFWNSDVDGGVDSDIGGDIGGGADADAGADVVRLPLDPPPAFDVDPAADPAAPLRRWLDADAARNALGAALTAFIDDAILALESGAQPPALACRVTAGTGKTTRTLRAIADRAPELLAHGSVLVFTPGHVHADEALAVFSAMAPHVPASALRGRGATDPEDGAPLCPRADEAAALGGLGMAVRPALCEARHPDGGLRWAACRRDCRYFAQFADQTPRVVFLAHSYLLHEPGDLGPVALRVVDESFHTTLAYSRSVDLFGWLAGPAPTAVDLAAAPALSVIDAARMAVLRALQADASPTAALRVLGLDRAALDAIVNFEEQSADAALGVRPWQSEAERKRRVAAVDRTALFSARARARIWRILADALARDTTERLSLRRKAGSHGMASSAIAFHVRKAPPLDAPLLMLDAEADPLITGVFAPHARFLRIDARPEAEVIQITDRTLSQRWLLDPAKGAARRSHVSRIVARETGRATGGVLLVGAQSVLEAMHRDHDPKFPANSQAALARPLHGAMPQWFGPGLRGVDAFKGYETVIVVGRLEPGLADIEDSMRAIFGDGDTPLEFLPRVDGRITVVHMRDATRVMADGTHTSARVSTHPDPRGRALLAQVREGASNQAIARLRLVSPDRPKRVVVLSSVPLPDLPVTRLLTWEGIICQRFREAIVTSEGDLRVTRVRLSATGLALDLPMTFHSFDAAKSWRRGRSTADLEDECRAIAAIAGATVRFEMVRAEGKGGKPTPMAVFENGK